MVQLNLLPDVKKEFIQARKARARTITIAILIMLISAGAVVAFALYVYLGQNVFIRYQTSEIEDKAAELTEVQDLDKYLTIQNQLSDLSSLHDDKHVFSRLLEFLPKLNPAEPNNMSLSSVDVDTSETTFGLQGTVKDFSALTTLKDTLANAEVAYREGDSELTTETLFSKVTIESAAYSPSQEQGKPGVSFTIRAVYHEAAFSNSSRNVSVTVPTIETTPSVVGAPQAVFQGGGNDEP